MSEGEGSGELLKAAAEIRAAVRETADMEPPADEALQQDLGQFLENTYRPGLERVASMLESLATYDVPLAIAHAREATSHARKAVAQVAKLRARNKAAPGQPNQHASSFQRAQQTVEQAVASADAAAMQVLIAVHLKQGGLPQEVEVARRDASALAETSKLTLEDALAALATAQKVAEQVGLNSLANAFGAARVRHTKAAGWWLIAAAAAAVILLGAALCVILLRESPPLASESWAVAGNVTYIGIRAFLFSVLSFLLVVCVRNYRAARHNEVINGHRADSVATLEAFRKLGDGKVEDMLMLVAADAVFAAKDSGYGDKGPTVSNHLVEMLSAMRDKPPG